MPVCPIYSKPKRKPCFLPDRAEATGFKVEVIESPTLLTAGITSTGPLARSLFILGFTEEQALLARVKGKRLVVFTGCGHPTIEVVLDTVRLIVAFSKEKKEITPNAMDR